MCVCAHVHAHLCAPAQSHSVAREHSQLPMWLPQQVRLLLSFKTKLPCYLTALRFVVVVSPCVLKALMCSFKLDIHNKSSKLVEKSNRNYCCVWWYLCAGSEPWNMVLILLCFVCLCVYTWKLLTSVFMFDKWEFQIFKKKCWDSFCSISQIKKSYIQYDTVFGVSLSRECLI